jgi:hypothetical protein
MRECGHYSCNERFRESMYPPFCSEYCHMLKEEKIIRGKRPVLERDCNWCGKTYEYRYGTRMAQGSFCNRECSIAAQGIRKYYSILNILKIREDEALSARQIAKLGEQHGTPMNYHQSSMRIRTLAAANLVWSEDGICEGAYQKHTHKKYFLNPDIVGLPFETTLKCLDKYRKTHRRDKIRKKRAADRNYAR